MVTCILVDSDHFEVEAGYHPGLMQVFKALPTRRYGGFPYLSTIQTLLACVQRFVFDFRSFKEEMAIPPI